MNFTSMFLGRVDYEIYDTWKAENKMEFIWKSESAQMFTVINSNLYVAPETFCWDSGCDNWDSSRGDKFIQDDPELEDYNVDERIDTFMDFVKSHHSPGYSTNNFMVTFGGDFHFKNANQYFDNIDKLIKYINLKYDDDVNMIYSTPYCYAEAVKAAKKRNIKRSKPVETKYLEAESKNAHIENSEVPNSKTSNSVISNTEMSTQITSNSTTATSDQNFPEFRGDFFPYSDSYEKETREKCHWSGYYSSRPVLKSAVRRGTSLLLHCEQWEVMGLVPWQTSLKMKKAIGLTQHHDAVTGTERQHVVEDYEARLKNATERCERVIGGRQFEVESEIKKQNGVKDVSLKEHVTRVTVYNSLAWARNEIVEIPGKGFFEMSLPGLGWLEIDGTSFKATENESATLETSKDTEKYIIQNTFFKIRFNPETELIQIIDKTTSKVHELLHEFRYYKASPGGSSFDNTQASGAYIFQPVENSPNRYTNVTGFTKISDTEMVVKTDKPEQLSYSWRLSLDKFVLNYAKSGQILITKIADDFDSFFSCRSQKFWQMLMSKK